MHSRDSVDQTQLWLNFWVLEEESKKQYLQNQHRRELISAQNK